MKNRFRSAKLLLLASVFLGALAFSATSRGQITLTPTITNLGGGLLSYQYSVSNTSLFDFSAISINVIAAPGAVQNLIAPSGFSAFFDPGLGQVDFVENTQNFGAGTTVGGFSFISPFAPQTASFTALRLDGSGNPITTTGSVLAPAPVPEPATVFLLAAGLAGLAALQFGRRRKLVR